MARALIRLVANNARLEHTLTLFDSMDGISNT